MQINLDELIRPIHDLVKARCPGYSIHCERDANNPHQIILTVGAAGRAPRDNPKLDLPELPEEPVLGQMYTYPGKTVKCVEGFSCQGCVLDDDLSGCMKVVCDRVPRKDGKEIALVEVPNAN